MAVPTPAGTLAPALRKDFPVVSDSIITLSDATFDESVLGSDEWCGPCKMSAPVLEDIAKEHKGKLSVAKLNVDDNPDVARRYEVLSIPTLLVFEAGELRKRLVGAKGKAQLLQDLSEFIA
jgi:thioredoxin 1